MIKALQLIQPINVNFSDIYTMSVNYGWCWWSYSLNRRSARQFLLPVMCVTINLQSCKITDHLAVRAFFWTLEVKTRSGWLSLCRTNVGPTGISWVWWWWKSSLELLIPPLSSSFQWFSAFYWYTGRAVKCLIRLGLDIKKLLFCLHQFCWWMALMRDSNSLWKAHSRSGVYTTITTRVLFSLYTLAPFSPTSNYSHKDFPSATVDTHTYSNQRFPCTVECPSYNIC